MHPAAADPQLRTGKKKYCIAHPCSSVAGRSTCFCIRRQALHVCVDCGIAFPEAIGIQTVLVTHGHMDHVGALHLHASTRSAFPVRRSWRGNPCPDPLGFRSPTPAGMWNRSPPTYMLPSSVVEPLERVFAGFRSIDESDIPCQFQGVAPGDQIALPRKREPFLFTDHGEGAHRDDSGDGSMGLPPASAFGSGPWCRPFPTRHRITSHGYLFYERKKKLNRSLVCVGGDRVSGDRFVWHIDAIHRDLGFS